MTRDLDWEKFTYYFNKLPWWPRQKLKMMVEILTMSRNRWAYVAWWGIVITMIVLAAVVENKWFSIVMGTGAGIVIGGSFIFWLFHDWIVKK